MTSKEGKKGIEEKGRFLKPGEEGYKKADYATTGGIYFTDNNSYDEDTEMYGSPVTGAYGSTYVSTILNIKNPLIDLNKSFGDISKVELKNYDGFIGTNESKEIGVLEPEQIHTLGSKQDIEGFKEFVGKPAQQTSEVKEIKEEDLSFKKGKLETFTLMSQQEVKGTAIVIEGQPNVDLFVWEVTKGYQYEGGWQVIDNNSKKGWPFSSFFGGVANTKSEVLEGLHSDIVKYSKEAKKKIELESIGFNFDKSVPQTSEVESELSEAEESVTPLEGQLLLDLTFALDNQYTTLTNFWDDKIQGDPEFKAKLRAQKILSLEDMVDAYKDGIYTSEEEFIESLGCL